VLFQYTQQIYMNVKPLDPNRAKNKNSSLQAQPVSLWKQMRKRASCFASCKGTATVETALAVPLFLSALCMMIMAGQLLILDGEIHHAVSKTAEICAKRESVKAMTEQAKDIAASPDPAAIFPSVFQGREICKMFISGGASGISIRMIPSSKEEKITVEARYHLKIAMPLSGSFGFSRKICAAKRLYTGYVPHGGNDNDSDQLVYLAEHGSVYHTSLSCSHITLRIMVNTLTISMLEARGIHACEKCIRKGKRSEACFITAEGDCYHSSISCSGLKRTVRMIRLSEVRGMRACSRCAGGIRR